MANVFSGGTDRPLIKLALGRGKKAKALYGVEPLADVVAELKKPGTIMGVSQYLKEKNPNIQIIGCQPTDGSQIPGIRKWPQEYLPKIFDRSRVDQIVEVAQSDAEEMTRKLAREEGIFAGISSGGAMWVSLEISKKAENATIVSIVCDRGDRYLSTGVFPSE